MQKADFYAKLTRGEDISLLIVGDSIAYGSGSSNQRLAWESLFPQKLAADYGCRVEATNLSAGGTDSLFGYLSVMRQEFEKPFDLIVLCHGQNDEEAGFARNYEGLLSNLLKRNPGCELIAVIESAHRSYNEKTFIISRLAEHYGCAVADMIEAFGRSGRPYDALVTDGVHPNDAGHAIYAEALLETVERGIAAQKKLPVLRDYLYAQAKLLERFRFIPRNKMFRRGLSLSCTAVGSMMCVHCMHGPNGEPYRVFVNGEPQGEFPMKHEFSWSWERVHIAASGERKERRLELFFQNANDSDRITGISVVG